MARQGAVRLTKVGVTYGRTFNLDDYESLRLDATVWGEFDEERPAEGSLGDADIDRLYRGAIESLFEVAKASVRVQAMPMLKKRNEKRAQLRAEAANYYDDPS